MNRQKDYSTLLNFRVPSHLKADFQRLCRTSHTSMTARLNMFIAEFVETETAKNPGWTFTIRNKDGVENDSWREDLVR